MELIELHFHHGGVLKKGSTWDYVGEEINIINNVDPDMIDLFWMFNLAKDSGPYSNIKELCYLTPNLTLRRGLKHLKGDDDAREIAAIGRKKGVIHFYVIHEFANELDMVGAQGDVVGHEVTQPTELSKPNEAEFVPDDESDDCIDEYVLLEDKLDYYSEFIGGSSDDSSDDELITIRDEVRDWNEKKVKELRATNLVGLSGWLPQNNQEKEGNNTDYEDSDGSVESYEDVDDEDNFGGVRKKKIIPTINNYTNFTTLEWKVGIRFPTKTAFKNALIRYAVAQGRNLRISMSNKNRQDRLGVRCDVGCPFYLYASWEARRCVYIVRSVNNKHTCIRDMNHNRQLKSAWLADQFLDVFKVRPHWPAAEIVQSVKENFKVIIKMNMAYKVKYAAHKKLYGSMEAHYNKLGRYVEALKTHDSESTFELITVPNVDNPDGPRVFQRLYVCFNGLKVGLLKGCIKVLCLDGCFLKTFLGGMLLAAVGRDANGQMYPLAWAIVEGENNDSWEWFLFELRKSLDGINGDGWTFLSDQQKGLVNAVSLIFPNAEHRNCARHIYANWKKTYKGDEMKGLFWSAVRVYSKADYNEALLEMKTVNPKAWEAFTNVNPTKFCRSLINTHTKCDVVVSNMAETFNGYILSARTKHIIPMLEEIRTSLMKRVMNQRIKGGCWDGEICPKVVKKLEIEKEEALHCTVIPSNDTQFQVHHVKKSYNHVPEMDEVIVDIVDYTCTCRKWDLTGIPCCHACACAFFMREKAEKFVSLCFKKEKFMMSYDVQIKPMVGERHWPEFDFPLLPPPVKIAPGRPRKNRRKDPHEDPKRPGKLTKHGVVMSCSICKSKTHNKRRCPNIGEPSYALPPKRGRGRPPLRLSLPMNQGNNIAMSSSDHNINVDTTNKGGGSSRGEQRVRGVKGGGRATKGRDFKPNYHQH